MKIAKKQKKKRKKQMNKSLEGEMDSLVQVEETSRKNKKKERCQYRLGPKQTD